jgi:Domain of unknown function (DUF3850)
VNRQTLKIWPADLEQIRMGKKKSEVRRCDDRKFRVGEELELVPWDFLRNRPGSGEIEVIRVTHIERMAGPIVIAARVEGVSIPLAVLSFELL